ncbi:hypothetical protein RAAC3_TM7C00001G0380 [Candidatus Saccharibacteria bacterium RAAC3_TM7_1]|nr:hypothetical protein RAAC3_TM7C00001G0380 [Candidatus Saccharibacteria bacterium RAAC3_TM7_1]
MLMFKEKESETNMAEEDLNQETTSSDDVTVLRELLHKIRGLSPVSTTDFAYIPADADEASDVLLS